MIEVLETSKEVYVERFERFSRETRDAVPGWLDRARNAAISRFAELGFPTTRHEEWRYTNVNPIARTGFAPASNGVQSVSAAALAAWSFTGLSCTTLVFVNGRYVPALSQIGALPKDVRVASLADVLSSDPEAVEPWLARYAATEGSAFTALNTAFLTDGTFISVPPGCHVEEPIHVLYVTAPSGDPVVSHPRTLVLAGAGSQFKLIESYVGMHGAPYFTNAVTEIVQGENAIVDFLKIQRESLAAYHVATIQIHQERDSAFSSHSISLGGALVRNDINSVLDGEGCDCTLNGLYLIQGHQHEDNHTRIEHAKPHCTSHELYKGVLDGNATGVFNGKIHVRKDAQKTDAKQTNKNLLRSENASINTKPQLEIFADDVKCTHGATIGQLDEDAVFYLRARGIGHADARNMLTGAFARDIIGRIKLEPVRARLEQDLLERLENGTV